MKGVKINENVVLHIEGFSEPLGIRDFSSFFYYLKATYSMLAEYGDERRVITKLYDFRIRYRYFGKEPTFYLERIEHGSLKVVLVGVSAILLATALRILSADHVYVEIRPPVIKVDLRGGSFGELISKFRNR